MMKKRAPFPTTQSTKLLLIVMITILVFGIISACTVPSRTGQDQLRTINPPSFGKESVETEQINISQSVVPSFTVASLTRTPIITLTTPSLTQTPVLTPTLLLKTYPDALAFTRENGGCQLPCILGVNLGKTPIKEYRKALKDQFGLLSITFDHKDAISHDSTTLTYHRATGIESAASLSLFYTDELIKGLDVGGKLSALPYLSIKEILANRGVPQQAFVDYLIIAPGYGLPDEAEFSLALYYQNSWMGVRYNSLAKKEGTVYTFCSSDLSENSQRDTSVFLMSQSFDKAYSDKELGEIFIGSKGSLPQGVDIQDALEMSTEDFYHRIMEEDAPCFQTKIQFWKNFINGEVRR